jgi:hypothetical protein
MLFDELLGTGEEFDCAAPSGLTDIESIKEQWLSAWPFSPNEICRFDRPA